MMGIPLPISLRKSKSNKTNKNNKGKFHKYLMKSISKKAILKIQRLIFIRKITHQKDFLNFLIKQKKELKMIKKKKQIMNLSKIVKF